MMAVTAEQFQSYYQQWTKPIVEEEEGDTEAQHQRKLNAAFWVAYCYYWKTGGVGRGQTGEARRILKQAIQEQDNINSNNNQDNTGKHRRLLALALCHSLDGGERHQADELFRQAVPRLEIEAQGGGNDDNHKEAAYYLARCLFKGQGVDKDLGRAIHWYKIAAGMGHSGAQVALVHDCRNDPTIFDWWKQMAVEHEHAWAQFALGLCYEYGDGVETGLVTAVEWYNKAIAQQDEEAMDGAIWYQTNLLSNLSPEERDQTLGGVERNQKIEKANVLIRQQPTDSVPLGIWAFVLGSFQNPIHHPCESPSPTFVALCEGIMPQFKKES